MYRLEASWVAPELKLAADRLKRKVSDLIIDEQKSNQRTGKYSLADDLEDQPFFAPRLYLNNLVNLKPEENEEWFTVYEGAQGEAPIVCFRWKFKGTFQEVMELRTFPFDVQNLTIEIMHQAPHTYPAPAASFCLDGRNNLSAGSQGEYVRPKFGRM